MIRLTRSYRGAMVSNISRTACCLASPVGSSSASHAGLHRRPGYWLGSGRSGCDRLDYNFPMIDFTFPPEVEEIRLKVRRFMDEGVRPEWEAIDQKDRGQLVADDRQAPQGCQGGVGYLAAAHARRMGRHGARADGDGRSVGRGRQGRHRAVRDQCPGARRRQPAHAGALGDARAEGEVPTAVVRRARPARASR